MEDDQVMEYLTDLNEKIHQHRTNYGTSDKFVLIHLGVNSGLKDMEIQLERRCYNAKCFVNKNKVFRGPNFPIDEHKYLDAPHKTKLPINAIFDRLKKDHPCAKMSDDPGRYLCNYI